MYFKHIASCLIHVVILISGLYSQDGYLLVISQAEKDAHFLKEAEPFLEEMAKKQGLTFMSLDPKAGLPSEISTTPAIVMLGDKGTSIYTGRYMDFHRIKSFLRSSRVLAQPDQVNLRKGVSALLRGRAKVAAQIKVTSLEGEASTVEVEAFSESAISSLQSAFQHLKIRDSLLIHKTDRTFFLDLHPYLGQDQKLYLSCAVYSQFHCTRPIFDNYEQPIVIHWEDREEGMASAARLMEDQILKAMESSEIGDAFSPVSAEAVSQSWEQLFPDWKKQRDIGAPHSIPHDLDLPRRWAGPRSVDSLSPLLQFNFFPPLDWYSGELVKLKGQIVLDQDMNLIQGSFIAGMSSLTMGNAELDEKVWKKYLKVKKYPEALFIMEMSEPHLPLEWGKSRNVRLKGNMTLMKESQPLEVEAILTPFLDKEEQPCILVSARFSLNITDDFGIDGPESGPPESRKNMEFNLNCLMSAEDMVPDTGK